MKQRTPHWNSPLVVFLVVFCLVLTTGTLVARELNTNARNVVSSGKLAFVKNWRELAALGHARGSSAAPIRVILFSDYQCPGCAALHQLFAQAADSMQHRLQIVTRHFPLSGHEHARAAANAAECAADQGQFDNFEDIAYRQQDSIGITNWVTMAVRAGVSDTAMFARCAMQAQHRDVVDRDRSAALSLKLAGTPVYIVNGQPYFGAPSFPELMKQFNAGATNVR